MSGSSVFLDRAWPVRKGGDAVLRGALCVLTGSLLLAVSAHVPPIPFWPVPLNMQTFVVLVLGMVYGPGLGAATVAAYLLEGAFGLPVFANGGGLAYFAGPTAGYLVGFVPAAAIAGTLARNGWTRTLAGAFASALLADALIFAAGVSWLAVYLGDVAQALHAGLMPFLLGDLLKVCGAAVLAWALVRGRGRDAGQG
ncbi:MAG TPA: biotin transporter BioY [Gammaproteobacteria bacterium]|nr:biotin transporter BioY [Gammaproteobacteria bacterium]